MSSLRLSFSHDVVGIRSFSIKADDNVSVNLGGNTSEIIMNGDGTANKHLTRKAWEISDINVAVDLTQGDIEFLQEVQNSRLPATIVYKHNEDVTYSGIGTIVGDLNGTFSDGYVSLTLSGGGVLSKI